MRGISCFDNVLQQEPRFTKALYIFYFREVPRKRYTFDGKHVFIYNNHIATFRWFRHDSLLADILTSATECNQIQVYAHPRFLRDIYININTKLEASGLTIFTTNVGNLIPMASCLFDCRLSALFFTLNLILAATLFPGHLPSHKIAT